MLSKNLHQVGSPVLVSPLLLRKFNCGQVDLCLYHQREIKLFEVKNDPNRISKTQIRRLYRSLDFLIQIFDSPGKIEVINSLPKDLSFLTLNI